MQYGCIGEHLTYSFSREIHGALAEYLYELTDVPAGELDAFMTKRDFKAINVTIPYKQAVIPYLTQIHKIAADIGAVNTVVNKDGQLYGYNTDFGGMVDLLSRAGISLEGKKVLILGTGGTSKTAMAVAKHLGAASVFRVSRTGKCGALSYEAVKKSHLDAQILINTTPRGMVSYESGMAIDPALFPQLSGVVDVVYNPLRTELIARARAMGVPTAGGLYMLVRQAVLASEIFLNIKYPKGTTERVYRAVKASKENIVLIGMPGCGKTTVGELLARKLGRPFYDVDALVEEKTGMHPSQIISRRSEVAFRQIESEVIRELASKNGAVIATGGGSVLRQQNVDVLRMNGKLIFLDRSLQLLMPTDQRPLSATKEALQARYTERYDIYTSAADAVVSGDGTPEAVAQLAERSFME